MNAKKRTAKIEPIMPVYTLEDEKFALNRGVPNHWRLTGPG